MSTTRRILTVLLGLFLAWSGVAKFTGGYVFPYIESTTGIGLIDPYLNSAVGVAEIAAGLMIVFRSTRLYGSIAATGLMAGAIGFHLSPWLGIMTPTGFAEGAAAPWDASDFEGSTPTLFIIAIVTGARALSTARYEWRNRSVTGAAASAERTVDLVNEATTARI